MADNDLVYFKQGIPAGQQMDRYSSNPGMLLSKNADIFSSSNSYKATAFSTATAQDSGIVDMDDKGRIILKTNGDVVDTANNNTVICNPYTNFDGVKMPVSYTGYTPSTSNLAEFGPVKRLLVKYEHDEWSEIVVYSDRTKYTYSKVDFDNEWEIVQLENCTLVQSDQYRRSVNITLNTTNTSTNGYIYLRSKGHGVHGSTFFIGSGYPEGIYTGDVIKISAVRIQNSYGMVYDAETDRMINTTLNSSNLTITGDTEISSSSTSCDVTYIDGDAIQIRITLKYSSRAVGDSGIDIGYPYYYHEYYEYLPLDENRVIKDIGEYYFTSGKSSATLLNFSGEWVNTTSYVKKVRYVLQEYMAYDIGPDMDAVDCVVFDEKVYLICNKDGNGYIFPCDLSGGKGTPYIAYGVEFKSAIVLNYLIYLVGENRGVSTLFVYSGTELVHIIEGNKKSDGLPDYIDNDEQYKFNGMIADWRGLLVLGTTDNRIFCYGQTYGGRGGSFIHSLADGQTLNEIKTVGKDLYIKYTEGGVVKTIKYQNDTAIKNYNTDFEIVYPITIGSHLIEKEVYDLVCSYILPSSDCKLEFRLSVNHYYFWTFRIPSKPDLEIGKVLYLGAFVENYKYGLKLIEKNDEWYTFVLEGDLPIQNSYLSSDGILFERPVIGQETPEYAYTEFNHFRKIGEITSEGYEEGYYRNENINTKLECPRTHSVQLMVKGTGTANYTPEVFSVNLVSNQRHRG